MTWTWHFLNKSNFQKLFYIKYSTTLVKLAISSSIKWGSQCLSVLHELYQVHGPECFSKFISFCFPWFLLLLWMPQLHLVPCASVKFQFFLRELCCYEGFSKSQDLHAPQRGEMAATEISWLYKRRKDQPIKTIPEKARVVPNR